MGLTPLPTPGILCLSVGHWSPSPQTQCPYHTDSSYYPGISPYLMTFVKYFPWNVKTTLCQCLMWDEESTAILDQLWCSTCVPMAGNDVGGHVFVLTVTPVTPRCHPQAAQGTGISSPPTTPGSRITNIEWFQLVFFS